MKRLHILTPLFIICCTTSIIHSMQPLGLFAPYDINIQLKKPSKNNFEFSFFGENSYKIKGYTTDQKEEETFKVHPLEIYECNQNIVSLYQGYDVNGAITQTFNTPFTQLLDSIAGGPGGGVSNNNNGIFKPCGNLSAAQFSVGATYGCGKGFYVSAFLPFYFTSLRNLNWKYTGTNSLFSDEKIQKDLVDTFAQDALKYFDLNIGSWKRSGQGDLAILAEWQRDFAQRRPVLNNVQATIRFGLTLPTSQRTPTNVIMPIDFGAEKSLQIPFGGGLAFTLKDNVVIGFNGQFWYRWSNEQLRRIKTFPTQTTLLLPIVAPTYKEYSIVQNFNLHASIYSFCKRFTLKGLYQYWRKGEDFITTRNSNLNSIVLNSNKSLDEVTRHQFAIFATYSPLFGDFKRFIPQFELFWKTSVNGTRTAIGSTYGAQLCIIF